jgi:hypothetical protein
MRKLGSIHVTPRYPTLFTSARVSRAMTFLCMIVLRLIHFSELYHRPILSRVVCRLNPRLSSTRQENILFTFKNGESP